MIRDLGLVKSPEQGGCYPSMVVSHCHWSTFYLQLLLTAIPGQRVCTCRAMCSDGMGKSAWFVSSVDATGR